MAAELRAVQPHNEPRTNRSRKYLRKGLRIYWGISLRPTPFLFARPHPRSIGFSGDASTEIAKRCWRTSADPLSSRAVSDVAAADWKNTWPTEASISILPARRVRARSLRQAIDLKHANRVNLLDRLHRLLNNLR